MDAETGGSRSPRRRHHARAVQAVPRNGRRRKRTGAPRHIPALSSLSAAGQSSRPPPRLPSQASVEPPAAASAAAHPGLGGGGQRGGMMEEEAKRAAALAPPRRHTRRCARGSIKTTDDDARARASDAGDPLSTPRGTRASSMLEAHHGYSAAWPPRPCGGARNAAHGVGEHRDCVELVVLERLVHVACTGAAAGSNVACT